MNSEQNRYRCKRIAASGPDIETSAVCNRCILAPAGKYLFGFLLLTSRLCFSMDRGYGSLTGQNAQQHIHDKLIEKEKEHLTSSHLSVAEIAYQLGFEHPQSFNKLFKKKTNLTPIEFIHSFN